jgi:kynurenine formamidase
MPVLADLCDALRTGRVEVVDLTAPLHAATPVLQLPPPFANASPFALTEISRFDDRGPAWYWNDISTSEHTGTHFDAPAHWITGRDGEDVAQVPAAKLVAPAAVLDFSAESAKDPDFLLEVDHVRAWEAENGPLPDGGWLLYRTGWDARSEDAVAFLNSGETGPHTPGSRSSARGGSRRRRWCRAWASRRSGPTPEPPTPSTRPSRATPTCSAPASTGSPSCRTSRGCRPPERW